MVKFHYDDIEIWRAFRESKKAVLHMRNLKWSVSSTLNTSHTNSINLVLVHQKPLTNGSKT